MAELRGDATTMKAGSAVGWSFAVSRTWQEREHPRASYLVGPRVWRPEWQTQAEGVRNAARRALKNCEPRFTAVAYSDRAVYLVEVVNKLSAEHVGRMLYLADLLRRDVDYSEHRSKRQHLVMLVREAAPSLLDFARRRRIRVVVLGSDSDAVVRSDTGPTHQEPAAPTNSADQ